MAEPHVIGALRNKRAELAGRLRQLEQQLALQRAKGEAWNVSGPPRITTSNGSASASSGSLDVLGRTSISGWPWRNESSRGSSQRTVPELAPRDHAERAFALFYTGTIGSGAIAPVLFGVLGDASAPDIATIATAATALAIFPLALALGPHLTAGDIA